MGFFKEEIIRNETHDTSAHLSNNEQVEANQPYEKDIFTLDLFESSIEGDAVFIR